MDESSGGEGIRDRISSRGEDALGELAQTLLDNPWLNQALKTVFEARDKASQAGTSAIRNLNLPTASDVDRLGRRLRALSERLEAVEDIVDRLSREVNELRRQAPAGGVSPSQEHLSAPPQERLEEPPGPR
jgi:hypothetical protein